MNITHSGFSINRKRFFITVSTLIQSPLEGKKTEGNGKHWCFKAALARMLMYNMHIFNTVQNLRGQLL